MSANTAPLVKRSGFRRSVYASNYEPSSYKRGWLEKHASAKLVASRWQRRWFVLENRYLRYYKEDGEQSLLAAVDLRLATVDASGGGSDFALHLDSGERVLLRAASADEASGWLAAIVAVQAGAAAGAAGAAATTAGTGGEGGTDDRATAEAALAAVEADAGALGAAAAPLNRGSSLPDVLGRHDAGLHDEGGGGGGGGGEGAHKRSSMPGAGSSVAPAEARLDRAALAELARAMEQTVEVRDRRWRLRQFRQCFVAAEAASWLREHLRSTLPPRAVPGGWALSERALDLGRQLVAGGFIFHVTRAHDFEDTFLFFQFAAAAAADAAAASSPSRAGAAAASPPASPASPFSWPSSRAAEAGGVGSRRDSGQMPGVGDLSADADAALLGELEDAIVAARADTSELAGALLGLLGAGGGGGGGGALATALGAAACGLAALACVCAAWCVQQVARLGGAAGGTAGAALPSLSPPPSSEAAAAAAAAWLQAAQLATWLGAAGAAATGAWLLLLLARRSSGGGGGEVGARAAGHAVLARVAAAAEAGAASRHAKREKQEAAAATTAVAAVAAGGDGDGPAMRPRSASMNELAMLRRKLEASAPAAAQGGRLPSHFTDAWLASVLSKPHRTPAITTTKLTKALQARAEAGGDELFGPAPAALPAPGAPREITSAAIAERCSLLGPMLEPVAAKCGAELDCGSMYWHGFDRQGRPLLWVRPALKGWRGMNRRRELLAHVALLEAGLQLLLPRGVLQFALVADARGLGLSTFDPSLMRSLLKLMMSTYPERVGKIYVGPINMLVKAVHKMLSPLLPDAVKSKIVLMDAPKMQMLEAIDAQHVPHFFGGAAAHEFSDGAAEGRPGGGFDLAYMVAWQMLLKENADCCRAHASE